MTALVYLVACMLIGHAAAEVVELSCSDNATCIENLMKDFARSIRQKKTVRLYDTFEIEPLETRQGRASQGLLSKFLETHAFSYDWNDYTFRLARSQNRPDALDLEVYESRTAKDVSEPVPKKSKSKVEHAEDDDKKSPKRRRPIRRRQKKKVLQAVIPLLFGMKSTGAVIFALSVVTALVMKAFMASKLALMVTVGMALKRLYESYSTGLPETSNVLWNIARYFKGLFGFGGFSPLSSPSMPMPMYVMPQMAQAMGQMPQMPEMSDVFSQSLQMPTNQ